MGPSLGADSIREGIVAGVAGLVAVIFVMLVYYKRSGVNAMLALVLNAVILIAALSYFKAVADAAGYRRHHSDYRYGGGLQRADFRAHPRRTAGRQGRLCGGGCGFSKAFWTIIDTHVTTVVSCAFLFMFGDRPGAGLRRHAGDRPDRECFHGGVCFEDDFRLRVVRPPADDGAEYLVSEAGPRLAAASQAASLLRMGTNLKTPVSKCM